MKLYSYSSELLAFVEAKLLKTKCAAVGILIGAIIFFGLVTQNQSVGRLFEPRLVKTLTLENNILRQQLNLMLSRMNSVEGQMGLLYKLDHNLHVPLPNHTVIRDSLSHLMVERKGFKLQSEISGAATF